MRTGSRAVIQSTYESKCFFYLNKKNCSLLTSFWAGQCEKYCYLDSLILDARLNRKADLSKVISGKVLVIDTDSIYIYHAQSNCIEMIFDLNDLTDFAQINELRTTIETKINF